MSAVDKIEELAHYALSLDVNELRNNTKAAAKRFVLDSIGVGVAGSSGAFVAQLLELQTSLGTHGDARVWGSSVRTSAPAAAFMNAYQIHNAEFDCVHEEAVVHPMAVLLGTLAAVADRASAHGQPINGSALLAAVVVGVDIAAGLGIASRAALKFFRPATAGAIGSVLAAGRLLGFDHNTLCNAAGLVHAQLCGTMQAHIEGSPVLAMQVGFNARNAVLACDMAQLGIPGPRGVIEGPFGFFNLFEGCYDWAAGFDGLGSRFLIEEVAHKPFPSGRATHGIVDGLLILLADPDYPNNGTAGATDAIKQVRARVPTLTHRLVGRPVKPDMGTNYSRLCGAFVAALVLRFGRVDLNGFTAAALADEATLKLAERVSIVVDDNKDVNALTPIEVLIEFNSGQQLKQTVETVYGNPAKPMTRPDYLAKFHNNWNWSREPLAPVAEQVIERIETLEAVADVGTITPLLQPED